MGFFSCLALTISMGIVYEIIVASGYLIKMVSLDKIDYELGCVIIGIINEIDSLVKKLVKQVFYELQFLE